MCLAAMRQATVRHLVRSCLFSPAPNDRPAMALFQSAVLNKYLKQQDDDRIAAAYARFTAHFHDPAIQDNIRAPLWRERPIGIGPRSCL